MSGYYLNGALWTRPQEFPLPNFGEAKSFNTENTLNFALMPNVNCQPMLMTLGPGGWRLNI